MRYNALLLSDYCCKVSNNLISKIITKKMNKEDISNADKFVFGGLHTPIFQL